MGQSSSNLFSNVSMTCHVRTTLADALNSSGNLLVTLVLVSKYFNIKDPEGKYSNTYL